jgi:hypothetical protein
MKPFPLTLLVALLATAACHKTSTTAHRPPTLYGQWKYVMLSTKLGLDVTTTYPGHDSTILLQLDSTGAYVLTVNGTVYLTDTFSLSVNCLPAPPCDSMFFLHAPPVNGTQYPIFPIGKPLEQLSIANDTMCLSWDSGDGPAGPTITSKFVPYP